MKTPGRRRLFATDRQRWDAVSSRNRAADGAFLYAVRTTGIYCRPGCSSRRPNRDNVVFFTDWPSAERAGYRACRKCKPRAASGCSQASPAILQACRVIHTAPAPPRLRDLAAAVGVSPFHLHRQFKRTLGITPKAYASQVRLQRLKAGLAHRQNVTRAIHAAGFGSVSRCYESSLEALGMTPAVYREGATAVSFRYAIAPSYLGWVLAAATERGIAMIELGDSPDVLKQQLARRFPHARLVADDSEFAATMTQVLLLIKAPAKGLDLPLDIQGTAFQRRVWEALRTIPAGTTATYAAIAERIGCPNGARAVASACASNRLAVAIPCHRVIRGDGDLTGYRWGIERKRKLLNRENDAATRLLGAESTGRLRFAHSLRERDHVPRTGVSTHTRCRFAAGGRTDDVGSAPRQE